MKYFVVEISESDDTKKTETLFRGINKDNAEKYFYYRAEKFPEAHLQLRGIHYDEDNVHCVYLKDTKNGTIIDISDKSFDIPETLVEASSSPVEPL